MPLLMVAPDSGPPPPEADITVNGRSAGLVEVRRGQLLSIEAPSGGQVAALFAWTAADASEWLSPHHVRVFGGSFTLRMGMRMVTNRRRPMFVIGRDSLRRHDLLLPASEPAVEFVKSALGAAGITVPRIPDPVNLFLDARLGSDGSIDVRRCPARPSERVTMRVLIDAHVTVASGPTMIPEASASPPRPLRVRVINHVEDLPTDLPVLETAG